MSILEGSENPSELLVFFSVTSVSCPVLVQSALRNKFAERRKDCPAHVGRIHGLVKSSGHLRNGDCSTLLVTGTSK